MSKDNPYNDYMTKCGKNFIAIYEFMKLDKDQFESFL
jgi:hypothetical protein